MRSERDDLVQANVLGAVSVIEAQAAALAAQSDALEAMAAVVTELTRAKPKVSGALYSDMETTRVAAAKARDNAAKVSDAFVRGADHQRLAAFAVEVEIGQRFEAERGVREQAQREAGWRAEADQARAEQAKRQALIDAGVIDAQGWPIKNGKVVSPR